MKKFLILTGLLFFAFVSMVFATGTLTIAKSAWTANPMAGVNYTYVQAVTCTGNCYNVQVVDTLPTNYAIQGSSPAMTLSNGVGSWYGGDGAHSMTNSSQNFTFWGYVFVYQIQNITNTAECFGTQGGDATSTTILAMATPTFSLTPTKTNTPNWTHTATATRTATLTIPQQTATANAVKVLATQTAVAANAKATAAVTLTAVAATKTAVALTSVATPNMVNTMIAATKTAVYTNAVATANAAYTATATYVAGIKIHETQTAVALNAKQTQTAVAKASQTAIAKITQTAVYFLTHTKTVTPTVTQTAVNTATFTRTCTATPTATATHDMSQPWVIPTLGSSNVAQGSTYVNFVQATAWSTTSTAVNFYNATSPTGCVAGNLLLTVQPTGAVTSPVTLYQGNADVNGIIRGIKFSSGVYVSGTASGASIIIFTSTGKLQ